MWAAARVCRVTVFLSHAPAARTHTHTTDTKVGNAHDEYERFLDEFVYLWDSDSEW